MPQRYFLTTAIDYANGRPHFGHAYEKVLADVIARYHRSLGDDVYFLTGTDEHGQKVQQSARKQDKSPQQYVDEVTAFFQEMCAKLSITHSRFVRTTNPDHQKIVRDFLQKLYDSGQIYFQEHEGFYSTRQEQFVTEKEMVNGEWPEIFGEVVRMKEPNYFFRLEPHRQWLRDELNKNPNWILPSFRQKEVVHALEEPLNDLCISRPKSRLEWGIPLPFDDQYVTYVWFDALVNYVSFATDDQGNSRWPVDVHVIGKDILIPAHAVYWPIMLRALDLPQAKQYLVHGWWLNRGAKMSKSIGNAVDPEPYIEKFGADAFRYFVMREMVIGQDADFTDEKLDQRYKSDLGNDLGNLVNRSLSMLQRYRQGVVPSVDPSAVTETEAGLRSDEVIATYREAMEAHQIHIALQAVWGLVQKANQYVDVTAPWKMAKDPAQNARLDCVLAHLVETVRRLSVLIEPVLPGTSSRIRAMLEMKQGTLSLNEARFGESLKGVTLKAPEVLFPRLDVPAST